MSTAESVEIWVNCPDEAVALEIGRALVEARLAACANVAGPVRSVYRWEGEVETADEWSLGLKTLPSLVEEVRAAIRARHPYTLPAISVLPTAVDAETRGWIAGSVGGPAED